MVKSTRRESPVSAIPRSDAAVPLRRQARRTTAVISQSRTCRAEAVPCEGGSTTGATPYHPGGDAIRNAQPQFLCRHQIEFMTIGHRGKIPQSRMMKTILHLTLYREHFANIVAGTKKTEYRDCSPFWRSRLANRKYDLIQIRNGYAKNAPEMLVEFRGCRIQRKGRNKKFAIRLGRILKLKRWKQ